MISGKTPQDFGACGDGITDDRAAFQAAANSGYPIYIPWTPSGYKIGSRIRLPDGASFVASDKKPLFTLGTPGDWLWEIVGSDVELRNIRADYSAVPGGHILLRTDLNSLQRLNIEDHVTSNSVSVISDLGGTGSIVYLEMRRLKNYAVRGIGINLSRAFAYIYGEKISILYNGLANTNIGLRLVGNEGSFFNEVDVTCGTVTPATSGAHGFYLKNCQAVWIDKCMADMVGGGGFFLDGGNDHIYMNNCIASMVGTHGFSIVNNGKVTLTGCQVGGRRGMPYAPEMPGFYAANNNVVLAGDTCLAYNNVGPGWLDGGGNGIARFNGVQI